MNRLRNWVTFWSCLVHVALAADLLSAAVLFEDHFDEVLRWSISDGSVEVLDHEFLVIGSDGDYDDFAETVLGISLSDECPVTVEVRQKLASGGHGYVLPWQNVFFEDGNDAFCAAGFDGAGDWALGEKAPGEPVYFTGNRENPVPGENYWTITRIVFTASGGTLYMKPDDPSRGWVADEFREVASTRWTHSSIEKIRLQQPWDSTNYVDYLKIYTPPAVLDFGDLNGDGFVNSIDLDFVRANWGNSGVPGITGDANSDGHVNTADLDLVRANWGPGPAAIPEPGVMILGVLGAVSLLTTRARI